MAEPAEVVVTGLGVVSPLGHDLDSFWSGLLAGTARPGALSMPGSELDGAATYLVRDEPPVAGAAALGRATRFALAAARSALADAALTTPGPTPTDAVAGPANGPDGSGTVPLRIGVVVGAGTGDGDLMEAHRDGSRPVTGAGWWPFGLAAAVADAVGATGAVLTVSNACAAGGYAVALGAELIADGEADIVLAGGSEAVSRPAMGAFRRLGAVDPVHCRPFDADRAGTVYGEGAAFLVLESAASAAARDRKAYAAVRGDGWSCDAYHATAPEPEGRQATRAAREALRRAGAGPADVGAVVCHGTGTPLNDAMESRVVGTLLGDRVADVPAVAPKSVLGHSGGAAGAFSCLVAALVVARRAVPPTANLATQDPDCRLRLVEPGEVGVPAGDAVLVNAYAFGGNNISLVLAAP